MATNVGFRAQFDDREVLAALKRVESRIGKVNARFDQLEKSQRGGFGKVTKSIKGVDSQIKTTTRTVSGFGKAIASSIAAFGGIALLIRGFKQAVTAIADFEDELQKLSSITGLVGADLEGLGEKAIQMSLRFGTSSKEILEGFSLVGSAQPELLKNVDALAEVTAQAEILAKAGGLTLPQAVDALTKSMNQFGASADEAATFTDILATSQQKGAARVNELSQSMVLAGGAARAVGLSFEDTNVALQALAKAGETGSQAGTRLRQVLLRLATAEDDRLNPATNNLVDIIDVLSDEYGDITQLAELFGQEAVQGALALINQRDAVEELTGALNEQGNALEQANTNVDTLRGSWARLTATIGVFVQEGGSLNTFLRQTIDEVNTLFRGIQEFGFWTAITTHNIDDLQGNLESLDAATNQYKEDLDLLSVSLDESTSSQEDLTDAAKKDQATIELSILQREEQNKKLKEQEAAAKKAQAEIERLNKAFTKMLEDLASDSTDADIARLTGSEKIQAEYEQEIIKIDLLRQELLKLAQATGKELTPEQEAQIENLKTAAARTRDLSEEQLALNNALEEAQRIRDEQADQSEAEKSFLKTLQLEEQTEKERVNLLTESANELLTLEEYKQLRLLEIQLKYQQLRLDRTEDATDEEKELLQAQIDTTISQIDNLTSAAENKIKTFSSFGDFIKEQLIEGLGLNDAQAEAIIQGFSDVISGISDLWTSGIDEQIDEQERLLDSIRDRIDETEGLLQDELDKQAQGYANNVASKQAELDALKAEEERAAAERDALLKKQQKAQLVADTITQASGLVTMVANLLAQSAALGPFAGPIIAAIAIASMFALFAKMKAQARAQTAQGEAAFEGGPIDQFLAGRSDRYGGRGHRIEDSNVVVGGGEYLVNDQTTKKHRGFMDLLNSGKLDNIDLLNLVQGRPVSLSDRYANLGSILNEGGRYITRDEMSEIMSTSISRLIKESPHYYTMDAGTKKVVEIKGNTKTIINLTK